MPTGYTAGVQDGTIKDFRTFALRCARAFGATIHQRDNPADEAPSFQVLDPYYDLQIESCRARYERYATMTLEQAAIECQLEYDRRVNDYQHYKANTETSYRRYTAILDEVIDWHPPTPAHVHMKEFMIQQLENSIKGDCDISWYGMPQKQSPEVWLAEMVEINKHALELAQKTREKAAQQVIGANKWILDLMNSLPSPQDDDAKS